MKNKILILSNNCSGLIKFRKEVFDFFLKQGLILTVAAPEDSFKKSIQVMGCTYKNINFNRKGKNPLTDFLLILKYLQLIHSDKPNLVLTYTIKPNIYGGIACRLMRIPQFANITGLGIAAEKRGILSFIIDILYKLGLKKTKIVFIQNNHDKDYCIQKGYIRGKTILIPGSGVNLDYYKYQDYPQSNHCHFIFIGRILQRKGIDLYLDAARIIKKQYPDTVFHIIGPCEESKYKDILKLLQKEGVIIYHGPASDIRPFLKDIHCTIHPSFYNEGMSNVLLESCSSGRPVITTNKAGCADVVEDGKNGFIMKTAEVEQLVNLIDIFINLPHNVKKEMGDYSRKKMEKEFDRNIIIQEYFNNIKHILSN